MIQYGGARFGIAARAHRPDHVVYVGWVDIIIDHHDPAADIADGSDLGCDQSDLSRMTEIALLDRDHAESTSAAGLMQPGALDVRYAGALERIEQRCRTQEAALE